ncbi:glucosamine--fructose-6-phosphate aminotransferase (isomerizing) [Bradyrhizobium sp. USDA 4516]|uniref:glutamine--fructose-6-phosphate transaminase (isomerizing) n=1 Tax=Bradyrhizobium sp. USDA 4541 TaxID=2817704 RepID=UPI0020A48E96|nr:glutamine--fructose-6-phosphate transaminase (isomerizing) [Bradyrhizobium sp. USDA 4541]MCP1854754.1 glucosamine--fructose-6-phosphate aminotransferase (isomerizing) [Bradyrhizobium sp. USDA 4541]
MCGIVGILGRGPVVGQLVASLKRLEYRGYDSAGLATLEGLRIELRRAEGKLRNLEERLRYCPPEGHTGIGHVRWATHGKPTESNAHPHATENVAVVHNGIIENFRELRAELERDGANFYSETDTEVVAHLVESYLKNGYSPQDAVQASLPRLRGAFALAFLFKANDDLLIGARKGSPLAIGHGNGEVYLGSDAIALAPLTDTITYLEDGDWAVLTRAICVIYSADGSVVQRETSKPGVSSLLVDKENYRHFMAKEIQEQPRVACKTLAHYLDTAGERVALPLTLPFDFNSIQRISITACGTASYAGHIAKYWFERLARLPVEIDVASEFRYREAPLRQGDLAIVISQSGETADTLAALRYAKSQGLHTISVVNVPTSTIARESESVLPTLAGPEIGVASTKAFICQLMVLAVLAVAAGKERGKLSEIHESKFVRELIEVPRLIAAALLTEPQIEKLAGDIANSRDVLYLGRGTSAPLALEGALKLKEISYIHSEGYAAGELKHGPIALIDEAVPVVMIAPYDELFEKTVSNMQEVAARGGKIILITDARGALEATLDTLMTIVLPEMVANFTPMVYAIPLQLLAYHAALVRGADVDQPRNLAKSVTVE